MVRLTIATIVQKGPVDLLLAQGLLLVDSCYGSGQQHLGGGSQVEGAASKQNEGREET